MKPILDKRDVEVLRKRGISPEKFEEYYGILKSGYPFISLSASCATEKEIKRFGSDDRKELRELYQNEKNLKVLKFVPASGAASRMFKDLFSALEWGKYTKDVNQFFDTLKDYAFAEELLERTGLDQKSQFSQEEKKMILETLLLPKGMDYGALPKGIIKFHKYSDGHVRTAFEEHFHEGAMYAQKNNVCHLHFTVPADNMELINEHLQSLNNCLSREFNTVFEIQTSIQKNSTDTPAIYEDSGEWVRSENNEFLFRPAGHGALLENLNDLDADIIFVKNIDNVVPDRLKPITVEYKELLAGVLLKAQKDIFKFLHAIDTDAFDRNECVSFVSEWFHIHVSDISILEIKELLNRPIRVCGMVKNEGEPGGGPFIINDGDGVTSLQIVEGAQIDASDSAQAGIAKTATHFNPVDLVLGTKDYLGKKFNLLDYRNNNTGMVVNKNYQGKNIRALELPGLWNGAMHFWNTIFVEVPIETFNPVKTVFDLRRETHRG